MTRTYAIPAQIKAGSLVKYSASVKPNATVYDTNKMDKTLAFSKLAAGSYVYVVTAADIDGATKELRKTAFTVKAASTLTISGSMGIPNPLTEGTAVTVRGVVKSNYNISNVTAQIKTSGGTAKYTVSVKPNKASYDTHNMDNKLLFSKLPAGSYVYVVTATDVSGKKKELRKTAFTVKKKSTSKTTGASVSTSTTKTTADSAMKDAAAALAAALAGTTKTTATTGTTKTTTTTTSGYPKTGWVTASSLNVRSGPSTSAAVKTSVSKNTQLTVTGQDAKTGWYIVKLSNGTTGYCSNQYITFTKPSSGGTSTASISAGASTGASTSTSVSNSISSSNTNIQQLKNQGYLQENSKPNMIGVKSTLPITPQYTNSEGKRNPDAYDVVINQLNVENNRRYLPRKGETFCNIFAQDVTAAMGCPLPRKCANEIYDWLGGSKGKKAGWKEVTASEAQKRANAGYPTVMSLHWPEHGHVQMVRPNRTGANYVVIAQAGSHNYNYGKVDGRNGKKYYTHD